MASEYDAIRDEILSREGIEVLRISSQDLGNLPILITSQASNAPLSLQLNIVAIFKFLGNGHVFSIVLRA